MKRFFPIGSVVSLKNGDKRLMITGYMQRDVESDKVWDYCACLFPEGNIDAASAILFDEDQIGYAYFVGLQDTECIVYLERLGNAAAAGTPPAAEGN